MVFIVKDWRLALCILVRVLDFLDQAPVPLSIFRSNSKFEENSKHSTVKYTRSITTIFCTRHDSVFVVTCANIVVIGRIYLKLERSEFSSNFEFDRNMLCGTGAMTTLKTTDGFQCQTDETQYGMCSFVYAYFYLYTLLTYDYIGWLICFIYRIKLDLCTLCLHTLLRKL